MKSSITRFLLTALCLLMGGTAAAEAAWYSANWTYRKAITIDYTKVGTGPHTNFPVLISITDSDLGTKAQADGDDILFTSADGTTKLDHEIESWNAGGGTLVAWVEIPTLSSSANTVIYMYYGYGSATNQQNVTGTWNSSFAAVWHLNGAFDDATSHNYDGTNTGTTSATGKIAGGREFIASDGADYITVSGLVGTPANLTLSAWMQLDSADTDGAEVLTLGDHVALRGYHTGQGQGLRAFQYTTTGWNNTASGNDYRGTGWHYVAYTFNDAGDVQVLYADNASVSSSNHTGSISYNTQGANTILGRHGNGQTTYDFDGILDEVRVSSSVRSSGWLLTEYHNQGSPGTFYSVATEELNNAITLSGNVFEDVTYSGGAGRNKAASSGVNRSGARVELFNASGSYVSATTTDASGNYSFSVSPSTSYTVRVVNSTVTSSLGGSSLLPVQTYRTTATSGSAVAVTDRVGGETPTLADAGNGSTTLAALTSGSLTPQSITSVTADTSAITGLDFGFNFSTVVNKNDTGQGSLRQFITNANDMSGTQTSVFMISGGSAVAGLRAGLTNQLTSGVAVITISSVLPTLSTTVTIDGTSQTTNIGNTNAVNLGTGGTVGVDEVTLSPVAGPEIEIVGNSGIANGLTITANSVTIKGLSIHGFGASLSQADINIGSVASTTVNQCVIGASATSFSKPAAATGGQGIYALAITSATITNNLIGFTDYNGIDVNHSSATGGTFQYNEIRGCGIIEPRTGGIGLLGTSHNVSYNLLSANKAQGLDLPSTSGGGITVLNNTISGNGVGSSTTGETPGVRVNNSNNTLDRNQVIANFGAGLLFGSSATGNKITRNSIYDNGTILDDLAAGPSGQIGIDLHTSGNSNAFGTAPYYTLNDSGDGDSGGNNLLNFPVLNTAVINGSNLTITGWARPGSVIELFISDGDPSGFGEGQTYLASLTEGSGSDDDATTGAYSNPVNGLNQGSDNTNKFSFTFTNPGGVVSGTKLTATATDGSNNTSEFSGVVTTSANLPDITVLASSTTTSDPVNGATDPKAIPNATVTYTITVTNEGPGVSDTDSVTVENPVPADTALFVGDLGGASSGPFLFADGATTSGLGYTFTSLASGADDAEFSNDGGTTYTYTPVPDGDGFDANVTDFRVSMQGIFAAASGGNNPSFSIQFRVRVD